MSNLMVAVPVGKYIRCFQLTDIAKKANEFFISNKLGGIIINFKGMSGIVITAGSGKQMYDNHFSESQSTTYRLIHGNTGKCIAAKVTVLGYVEMENGEVTDKVSIDETQPIGVGCDCTFTFK